MMAQFFFIALYMQNILGYSPLEAGVRFLPATLMIVVIAPLAGRLTDRIGAKLPIAAGLTLVTGALFWLTTVGPTSTYSDFFPSFILMGVGMALVMSPMSTAAMNAVATAKAGRRLRHPVDEPDGRRLAGRRRHRRRLPGRRAQPSSTSSSAPHPVSPPASATRWRRASRAARRRLRRDSTHAQAHQI